MRFAGISCRPLGSLVLLPLLAAVLCFAPGEARAQSKEYQVKAVFLRNFAQFVRWPASAFRDAATPLTMGILGDDPFGDALEAATRGESVGGRKIAIKRGRKADDLKGCQLVFIGKGESSRLSEHLSALDGSSILTIGESEAFCGSGGMINFTLDGATVGFEINTSATKRAGLVVSSRLQQLGKIYRP